MYSNLEKNADIIKKLDPVFNINFINGPYLEIRNSPGGKYDVSFIDDETGFVHYRTTTFNNCWAKSNISYFVKWRMKIVDQEDGRVFEYLYDAAGKKVFIVLESSSVGDTLAWFPYIDEFRKKWGCQVVCSTFWNHLFQSEYPELEFVAPGSVVGGIYAMYKIGWFYDGNGNVNAWLNPRDFKKFSLQQTASDILGIDFKHIRARICTVEPKRMAYKDREWLEQTYEDIFKSKEYCREEVDICKNDIVVDLGGNYGMFSLYAMHKGAKKVYTFEPFEEYVGYIRENTKNFANVEIMPFAISNEDGATKMNVNYEGNTILQEVYDRNNWQAESQIGVECMRFETFLERKNIDFVNFLKIDIEGSEYALFEDIGEDVLKNKVGKISMEYHWDNGRLKSIVEKLERCGFEVREESTNDQMGKIYAINRSFSKRPKKRVGIAMHSTAQTKYWNNPTGWQEVVDFLSMNGYEVVLLSKEADGYMGNFQPTGITKHPEGPFESLINVVKSCELFIGIGSGLSWLAWSLNVPTVLISGFSTPISEFEGEGVLRIFNDSVCNGCYNRYRFDAGDWNWCPDHKGTERQFECTKSITGSMVIEKLRESGLVEEKESLEKETVLILSTGRRIEYFKKTIESLFKENANLRFKKVWILDDRSTPSERAEMEALSKVHFGDNYNMIGLNSEDSCYFVEKFNLISSLVKPEDIVFLLEDDWECIEDLRLCYHIDRLKNSDWTQIAFADTIDIQEESIKNECVLDQDYWKNPYPSAFRHIHKWIGNMSIWNTVYINNWTNNPSVIKGEVFHRAKFNRVKNFEFDFAQRMGGKQVFTQKIMFRHFGEKSLIAEIK